MCRETCHVIGLCLSALLLAACTGLPEGVQPVDGFELGYLNVSFFGPFCGSYVVLGLDREEYQYAFVAGPDTSCLWLIARTPTVSNEVLQRFIERSAERGFETEALMLVAQE